MGVATKSRAERYDSCRRCGEWKVMHGRGLDRACYRRSVRDGVIEDYPRVGNSHPPGVVVEETLHLLSVGCTTNEVARRLGMTKAGIAKALYRAKRMEEANLFNREYKREWLRSKR